MTTEFKLTPEEVAAIEALVIEISKTGVLATETRLRGRPSTGTAVSGFQTVLKLLGVHKLKSEPRAHAMQSTMAARNAALKAWIAAGRPGLDATPAQ